MPTDLVFTDPHAPFMHPDAVPFLSAVKKKYRPDNVICGGDVVDLHAFSRFKKDQDADNGSEEMKKAARQLKPLYRLFPDVRVCWGNHDRRIYDRAGEIGIPESAMKGIGSLVGAPAGWEWRTEWKLNGVIYEHGEQFTGRDAHLKAAAANMQHTVIGHVHAHAGIHYVANRRHLVWGFNAGCLIDRKRYAFKYAQKSHKPIVGCGIIIDQVPQFVPMLLKSGGRWTGRLTGA